MKYFRFPFAFFIVFVFAAVLFSTDAKAQNDIDERLLFAESEGLVYKNPDEALKVALHLLSKNTSEIEKSEIYLLIAEIYKVKGDYSNALTHLYEINKGNTDLEPITAVKAAVAKSEVLRTLYLDRQSGKYYQEAVDLMSSVKDTNEKKFCRTLLLLEETGLLLERQNYSKALNLMEKNSREIDETSKTVPYFDLWFTIFKGKTFLGLNDFNKASVNFNRALELITKDGSKNSYAEAFVLVGLANVNFHKKQHQLAVPQLLKALATAKAIHNIYLSQEISKLLVDNYIALNDKINYKLHNAEFFKLNAEVENGEQESVNTAYNLIAKEYEKSYGDKRQGYFRKLYLVLGIFVIVALFSAAFWFRVQWDQKRLKEIINYLEITRSNLVILTTEKKEKKNGIKKTLIPEETEQLLLKKLKRFEGSTRFTNNDMSLSVLAGQFDTNTKYLSEIINSHYGVNFNTYINKLRINYIVEKLKSDPNFMNYKISYLAESSGFSSHSSFATVFKSITGIAPVTFIELLKNEKEIINP